MCEFMLVRVCVCVLCVLLRACAFEYAYARVASLLVFENV